MRSCRAIRRIGSSTGTNGPPRCPTGEFSTSSGRSIAKRPFIGTSMPGSQPISVARGRRFGTQAFPASRRRRSRSPTGRSAWSTWTAAVPPQIKMRASYDGGRTWPEDSEIVIERPQLAHQNREKRSMQDAWSEMAAFSFGLPTTAVAPNGDTVVVYYSGPATDQTDVKWARVKVAADYASA